MRQFACEICVACSQHKAVHLENACSYPAARWCVAIGGRRRFFACLKHTPRKGFITSPVPEPGLVVEGL